MHLHLIEVNNMSTISVRLDSNDKHLFEEFCNDVGMSISTAVNMFVKNVMDKIRADKAGTAGHKIGFH